MDELTVVVKADTARFIYNDDLLPMQNEGKMSVKRASHVEPCEGGWSADLGPVAGPVLGPFATRNEALAAEVAWLKANQIPAVV